MWCPQHQSSFDCFTSNPQGLRRRSLNKALASSTSGSRPNMNAEKAAAIRVSGQPSCSPPWPEPVMTYSAYAQLPGTVNADGSPQASPSPKPANSKRSKPLSEVSEQFRSPRRLSIRDVSGSMTTPIHRVDSRSSIGEAIDSALAKSAKPSPVPKANSKRKPETITKEDRVAQLWQEAT